MKSAKDRGSNREKLRDSLERSPGERVSSNLDRPRSIWLPRSLPETTSGWLISSLSSGSASHHARRRELTGDASSLHPGAPRSKRTYQQNEGRATSSAAPLTRARNTRTELVAAAARFAKRRDPKRERKRLRLGFCSVDGKIATRGWPRCFIGGQGRQIPHKSG